MDDPTIQKFVKDGNWLPNSPKHQFYADVKFSITDEISVALSIEALSKTYIDGANIDSEAALGYTLLHARASYDLQLAGRQVELSMQIRNITNKEFVAFTEPDPGGNAYQPGVRREVFAGIRVRL